MPAPRHRLIEIGAQWSSTLVLAEAELALHRWREDASDLRGYGWGEARRAAFEALVDRLRTHHDAWESRPSALSLPPDVLPVERLRARAWLDRAISILEAAELEHDAAATALGAIPPAGDGTATALAAVRAALARCLALRDRLDPDAADDAFFAEGADAEEALARALGTDPTDAQDRADALDALDGEIYLTIRGLNRAARRLFLGRGNDERAGRYAFQFLVTIGRGEEGPRRLSEPPRSRDG